MYFNNFVDKILEDISAQREKAIINFLNRHGYEVPHLLTSKYIKDLQIKLEKEDKFIDTIETSYIDDNGVCHCIIIPIFNSISRPMSWELKEKLMNEYLKLIGENNDKD